MQKLIDDFNTAPNRFEFLLGLPTWEVEQLVEYANLRYREGYPVFTDQEYDTLLIPALKTKNPESKFLKSVEPEPENSFGKTVDLPIKMLSTDKAYTLDEIKAFIKRCKDAASSIGIDEIWFRVTPKLDGFAACFTGSQLITRGNGVRGQDISHALARGLVPYTRQRPTKGEIVVKKEYFEDTLSGKFENSRSVIAAAIKEGELDEAITDAILTDNLRFMAFEGLFEYIESDNSLPDNLEKLWDFFSNECVYDTDGIVIEVTNDRVKQVMGDTNHHHRWQIAYKKNTEFHDIPVTGIEWQTSKSGRITPVVLLEPTKVSGVTISRATGHHAGNVISKGIDVGAVVRVCRSGLVIPYISDVVKPMSAVSLPTKCPSCGEETLLEGDNLCCTNLMSCPAQIEGKIEFFFKTLGNCDGFGPSIIEKICSHAEVDQEPYVQNIIDFYDERKIVHVVFGLFKEKTAANLMRELTASKTRSIEDWRFLAAFGFPGIGKGGCAKLLTHYTLDEIFDLTLEQIRTIDGFGEVLAYSLHQGLQNIKGEFDFLYKEIGFNLKQTRSEFNYSWIESPIAGKTLVFTGTMITAKRSDLESQAKALGATVSGSVSKNTDYLICGEKVGANKTQAAEKNGTTVLSEAEYLELIESTRRN